MPDDIRIEDIPLAQGPAKPATEEDLIRDASGITYPNLHRRIDDEGTPLAEGEVAPDQYEITVGAVNSFRTTKHTVHDESSTTSEIP